MPYSTRTSNPRQVNRFSAKSDHGQAVLELIKTRPKYVTVSELRKPAQVVDKLRRDFPEYLEYDRNSMKTTVRKFLLSLEVETAVKKFWNSEDGNISDSNVVSKSMLIVYFILVSNF